MLARLNSSSGARRRFAARLSPRQDAALGRGAPTIGHERVSDPVDRIALGGLTLERDANANGPPGGIENQSGSARSHEGGSVVARGAVGR